MRTTRENLTNNHIFALRVRADQRGDCDLVATIDSYLQERDDGDLDVILGAINDGERPGLLAVRFTSQRWRVFDLNTADDVNLLGGPRPERIVYVRGVYNVKNIRHLPLIEARLREVLEPLRAEGCLVEWYLDGPG